MWSIMVHVLDYAITRWKSDAVYCWKSVTYFWGQFVTNRTNVQISSFWRSIASINSNEESKYKISIHQENSLFIVIYIFLILVVMCCKEHMVVALRRTQATTKSRSEKVNENIRWVQIVYSRMTWQFISRMLRYIPWRMIGFYRITWPGYKLSAIENKHERVLFPTCHQVDGICLSYRQRNSKLNDVVIWE